MNSAFAMGEVPKVSRNILTLQQRVQAIRDYDSQHPKPKIQQLAHKYNVSSPQMKNVIANREYILNYYEDELVRKRQGKIEFLGKVMYEYIQRTMNRNICLDDEHVLEKAKEINDCICVVNFVPTHSWLHTFKEAYGIPSFDLETLRKHVQLVDIKRLPLTTIDLIAYVSSCTNKVATAGAFAGYAHSEKSKIRKCLTQKTKPKTLTSQSAASTTSSTTPPEQPPPTTTISFSSPVPEIEIKDEPNDMQCEMITDGGDDTEMKTTISPPIAPEENANQMTPTTKSHCVECTMREIVTMDDALQHLRLLEEYAMLQDNYRAIGLLTQLEDVLKRPLENS